MVQEGRSRGHNVDMRAASLQGRYAGTNSRLHWSMSVSARSTSIRAFVAGCIRVEIRRFRPSYTGHAANAYKLDFRLVSVNLGGKWGQG